MTWLPFASLVVGFVLGLFAGLFSASLGVNVIASAFKTRFSK